MTDIKTSIINDNSMIRANISSQQAINATETDKGLIRIATEEEAKKGISTNTAITPKTLNDVLAELEVLSGNIMYEVLNEEEI